VGERSGRGDAGSVGDSAERDEHAAGEKPPSKEAEHQKEHQRYGSAWAKTAHDDLVADYEAGPGPERAAVQEGHPHGGEQ
jgi:hypothetical protein